MTFQALLPLVFHEGSEDSAPSHADGSGHQNQAHNDSDSPGVDGPERSSNEIHVDGAHTAPNEDSDSQDDDEILAVDHLHRFSSMTTQRFAPGILSRILASIFPAPDAEEDIESYIPNYRYTPIIAGIVIPFSILLEIPGLTERWYIRTEGSTIVETKSNPVILDVGLAFSMACAVLANACLIVRFLEKRVKIMTILCTIFLSMHDIINIVVVATFGIEHRFDDGFTYGDSFWMTVCSTIVSSATNVTLIFDLIRTPDFERSGSGLTRRQRSLAIIIIVLFCYIALGALVNSLLLDLSFIDGLYFTVTSIETIGFGDISPDSTASRVFICIYSTLGIVGLAVVVGVFREMVLEGLDIGYRTRLKGIQERRRVAHRQRRAENRWRHAIIWRLRARHAPIWVPEKKKAELRTLGAKLISCFWRATSDLRSTAAGNCGRPGMKLNLEALPHSQLEAAALEAGVPLDTLLPPNFYPSNGRECCWPSDVDTRPLPSWFVVHPVYHVDVYVPESLTYNRLGGIAAMLTKLGLAIFESGGEHAQLGGSPDIGDALTFPRTDTIASGSSRSLSASSSEDVGGDYRTLVVESEKKAFYARSSVAWTLFILFWTVGSAIFMQTEGWSYALSMYFCFVAFTTIGYGDLSPKTPAGRSIFVVWALLGVGTMTILVSIVSEAYSSRYKGMLGNGHFDRAVKQYRKRTRVGSSEKPQGSTNTVRFHPREPFKRNEASPTEGEPLGPGPGGDTTLTITMDHHLQHAGVHTQRSLEELPRHVLNEARSAQHHMRFIGDWGGRSAEAEEYVDQRIRRLLDDVVGGVPGLSESAKVDVLRDEDSRRTLVMLSMERSLSELVNIAERAIAAIDERDRVIAALRDSEEHNAAEACTDVR